MSVEGQYSMNPMRGVQPVGSDLRVVAHGSDRVNRYVSEEEA
jgi:hypothetical protein